MGPGRAAALPQRDRRRPRRRATPRGWLARAHELEQAAGRTREVRWGARTLDVDVVTVTGDDGTPVLSDDPELTLPHPRAHERAFVLVPWLTLEPGARSCPGAAGSPTSWPRCRPTTSPRSCAGTTCIDARPPPRPRRPRASASPWPPWLLVRAFYGELPPLDWWLPAPAGACSPSPRRSAPARCAARLAALRSARAAGAAGRRRAAGARVRCGRSSRCWSPGWRCSPRPAPTSARSSPGVWAGVLAHVGPAGRPAAGRRRRHGHRGARHRLLGRPGRRRALARVGLPRAPGRRRDDEPGPRARAVRRAVAPARPSGTVTPGRRRRSRATVPSTERRRAACSDSGVRTPRNRSPSSTATQPASCCSIVENARLQRRVRRHPRLHAPGGRADRARPGGPLGGQPAVQVLVVVEDDGPARAGPLHRRARVGQRRRRRARPAAAPGRRRRCRSPPAA